MKRVTQSFLLLLIVGSMAAAASIEPDSAIPLDGYAAVVNDRIITVSDVLALLQPVEQQLKQSFAGAELQKKLMEAYAEARDSLVDRALILTEFTQQEGKLPDAAVEDRIGVLIRERFGNDRAAFLAALAEERITMDEWREQVREQLIVSILRRQEVGNLIKVSPSDVRAAYELRRETFAVPEKIKLRMIVLNKGATDGDHTVKVDQAGQIRARLEAGEDFSTLAKTYSEGGKASRGGDWGWVEPSLLRPELAKAIEPLSPGALSPVIEAGDELYILLVEARQNAHIKTFEDVQQELTDELRKQEGERLHNSWMARLKNKYFVKVY